MSTMTILAGPSLAQPQSAALTASPQTLLPLSRSSSGESVFAFEPTSPIDLTGAPWVTPTPPSEVGQLSRKRPFSDITPPPCACEQSLRTLEVRVGYTEKASLAAQTWHDRVYQHVKTTERNMVAKLDALTHQLDVSNTAAQSRMAKLEGRLSLLEQQASAPHNATTVSGEVPTLCSEDVATKLRALQQRVAAVEQENAFFLNPELAQQPLQQAPMPTRWDEPVSPKFSGV